MVRYNIEYSFELLIRPKYFKKALDIFNNLHSDEMLQENAESIKNIANKQLYPVRDIYKYKNVDNPSKPFSNLKEAFTHWNIASDNTLNIFINKLTKDLTIKGKYNDLWYQQDFLLCQLASVLKDTEIFIKCEDLSNYLWIIEDHTFRQEKWTPLIINYEKDESSSDSELEESIENFKIAL